MNAMTKHLFTINRNELVKNGYKLNLKIIVGYAKASAIQSFENKRNITFVVTFEQSTEMLKRLANVPTSAMCWERQLASGIYF